MKKTVVSATSSDGLSIYADSNGNSGKPALVFIHGFSLAGACFDKIFEVEEFSKSFHLVRYDLRGQGRSGAPTKSEGHVSKMYADDFKAVCEAFQLQKPYLVGWSYGCSILSDVATYLPGDYLSGAVFLCGAPFLDPVGLGKILTPSLLSVLPLIADEKLSATEAEAAAWRFADMVFYMPDEVPMETKWYFRGMMSSTSAASRRFALDRTVDPTRLYELGRKDFPVHLIVGKEEGMFKGPELEEAMRPNFTKMTTLFVEKGGHSTFHQNTQMVVESITEFVKNNSWTGGTSA